MTKPSLGAKRVRKKNDLFALAADRNGVFTASAARQIGIGAAALAYYLRSGAIERFDRGVYRVAHFPLGRHDALVTASARLGADAIVSHESALALHGVCDVAPSFLHFTMPRSRRYVHRPASDVVVHTATRPFHIEELVQLDGFKATSLVRSIIDSARTHTAPEQIEMAIRSGLERGLLTQRQVERAKESVSTRVRALIEAGLP